MIFGILVTLLMLVSVGLLALVVLREPSDQDTVVRDQQNIDIARDKKKVLEQQLADEQMTQEEFESAMQDLEASLAIDLERHRTLQENRNGGRWAIWIFVVMIPFASFYLYWHWGSYQVVENPMLAQPRNVQPDAQENGETPTIDELLTRLKAHLRENQEDVQGWFMLGRTYLSMQQYPQAVAAFERSYELSPEEPAVMLALADADAMIQDGDMTGRPTELVEKALQIVPRDPTALWLAGLAAEQAERHHDAWDYWTRLLPLISEDMASVEEVRALLSMLKQKQPDLPELPPLEVADTTLVRLTLALDASLTAQASPDDPLFVYARAASGPPMPLAARRLTVADLPLEVLLSDSDAMMPELKLSSYQQIVVGARISKSGQPIAQTGDLYVESDVIDLETLNAPVELIINQIQP